MARLALQGAWVCHVIGALVLCSRMLGAECFNETDSPENETNVPDTSSSSSSDDGGGMAFIVKFLIFVLTYAMTVGGLIFGIKLAREHGYCKPKTATDKVKDGFRSATGGGESKPKSRTEKLKESFLS